MTAREQPGGLLPELFVIVASVEDADVLAALGGRDPEVLAVLVATGRDPKKVTAAPARKATAKKAASRR